jgi:hypothetical protein
MRHLRNGTRYLRTGIVYAGGQYEGPAGKETIGGDAYVVVRVPKHLGRLRGNVIQTTGFIYF